MNLARRMSKLEADKPSELPPRVKAWFGQPLTAAERARLNDPEPSGPTDTRSWSREAREWLGLD